MGSSNPWEGPEVRVGLCGFSMAADAYAREFPVVEVQQTFYEPPREVTMLRWRAEAPADFEFTLKAWQLVTHEASSPTYRRLRTTLTAAERTDAGSFRSTPIVHRAWARTLDCARLLRATAVLLQCPRSFRPLPDDVDRMRRFMGSIERLPGVRLLWEPRGDWPGPLVRELCEELRIVHVVDPFVADPVTPDQTYFRLHGITGARHVYTDAELRSLRSKLPSAATATAPAYVMFNNLPRVSDARRFLELLGESTRK